MMNNMHIHANRSFFLLQLIVNLIKENQFFVVVGSVLPTPASTCSVLVFPVVRWWGVKTYFAQAAGETASPLQCPAAEGSHTCVVRSSMWLQHAFCHRPRDKTLSPVSLPDRKTGQQWSRIKPNVHETVAGESLAENPWATGPACFIIGSSPCMGLCACSVHDRGREDQGQHVLQEQRDGPGHQGQNQGQWLIVLA